MAELVETYDLTTPEQHGWAVGHRIRRDDGEELHAEVRCWERAQASAENADNATALEAMADRAWRRRSSMPTKSNHQQTAGRS
jgi:hypothetical protein